VSPDSDRLTAGSAPLRPPTAGVPRLVIHPATADRFDDLRTVLDPPGTGRACWCLAYRLPSGEFNRLVGSDRVERVRELTSADPPPGVLAYVDATIAGWCGVGPRSAMGRLVRSRTILPVDDVPVWSVVCFVVRAGYRRQGLAEELLHGACAFARDHGAPAIEGYPVDPAGQRISGAFAYVGTTGMFERAGFRRLAATDARSARLVRWVYRRDL
jgi:GNAT superfamily N-acetyltransferase